MAYNLPEKFTEADANRFVIAALAGDLSLVRSYVDDGMPIDTFGIVGDLGQDGMTALYAAATNDHVHVLKFLLESGANPNCVMAGQFPGLNAPSLEARCALHKSIISMSHEAIDLLLAHGANPRILNDNRETAAHAILRQWMPADARDPKERERLHERLSLMLDRGVRINQIDKEKSTLLGLCIENKVPVRTIAMLLDRGAECHRCKSEFGATHLASLHDNVEALELLSERGIDFNTPDYLGRSPLYYFGEVETALALLERGANIDFVDDDGRTALAVKLQEKKSFEVCGKDVAVLVMAGTNLDLADFGGVTPRQVATERVLASALAMFASVKARSTISAGLRSVANP